MNAPDPGDLAVRCLPELGGLPLRLERLAGGGNNRLYRVQAGEHDVVLKHYFRHPAQPRDRLGAEFSFLEYAWGHGVRGVPRPLGRDEIAGAGIYAFVTGRPLTAGEIGPTEVREALGLVAALNAPARIGAERLGPAAEARFAVEEHLQLVEGRLDRLLAIEVRDDVDAEAARFVAGALLPAWREVRESVRSRLGAAPPRWALDLPAADRLISPSDFGFHNALRRADGRLAFLDFEYAGWDDPAKLVCDFFFQPALPAPRESLDEMSRGVAGLVADAGGAMARIELLWPVAGIKWCCILLNHFSPVDLARRTFAAADASDRRAGQLQKARLLLQHLWTGRVA